MLSLTVLPAEFSICRLPAMADVPINIAATGAFVSVTRTPDEVSVVCPTDFSPRVCEKRSDSWRCLRLDGVFDLSMTGILSRILSPLAASQISVFTISTFDTDYILIRSHELEGAIGSLTQSGIECRR